MPALLLAAMAIAAACNDGDEGPHVTIQPGGGTTPTLAATPTAAPTPTPEATPSPRAQEAPAAPVPTVDPSLEVLTTGELNLTLGPGDSYRFEPQDLANEAPGCGPAFAFLFGWQVQDPYPLRYQNVKLTIHFSELDTTEAIGEGASGTATTGCGFISASNDSAFPISVQIRYAIAQAQG